MQFCQNCGLEVKNYYCHYCGYKIEGSSSSQSNYASNSYYQRTNYPYSMYSSISYPQQNYSSSYYEQLESEKQLGHIAGIVGILVGITGLFIFPLMFGGLALVLGQIAVMKKSKVLGAIVLFLSMIVLTISLLSIF